MQKTTISSPSTIPKGSLAALFLLYFETANVLHVSKNLLSVHEFITICVSDMFATNYMYIRYSFFSFLIFVLKLINTLGHWPLMSQSFKYWIVNLIVNDVAS